MTIKLALLQFAESFVLLEEKEVLSQEFVSLLFSFAKDLRQSNHPKLEIAFFNACTAFMKSDFAKKPEVTSRIYQEALLLLENYPEEFSGIQHLCETFIQVQKEQNHFYLQLALSSEGIKMKVQMEGLGNVLTRDCTRIPLGQV